MKIGQISANDAVTQGILSEINKRSSLFQYLEFFKGAGNGASERKVNTDVNEPVARTLGSDYVGQILSPTYITAGRKIFGDKARLDVAYQRMGYDIGSEMSSQLKRFITPLINTVSKLLISGDSATKATDINGLKKLTPSSQVITPRGSANGLTVLLGNSDGAKKAQQKFLEVLDEAISKTAGANKVILLGSVALARFSSIAREYIQYTTNPLGIIQVSYNKIPIVNLEELGADIFPQTETVGTETNCSSIYVASFGEKEGFSLFSTNEGFMVYPVQKVGNFYESVLELICDSMLFDDKAVTRIQGLIF